jgi:hypothetical protein
MTEDAYRRSKLTGMAAKARDTGTVDSFKTIHDAALGHDEPGAVCDSLGLDTATDRGIRMAHHQIHRASQALLEHDRFPEQFQVYRAARQPGEGRGEEKGVVSVSTRPLGTFKEQKPFAVNRSDVLTYGEGLQQGTFKEDELHVEAHKLRPI